MKTTYRTALTSMVRGAVSSRFGNRQVDAQDAAVGSSASTRLESTVPAIVKERVN